MTISGTTATQRMPHSLLRAIELATPHRLLLVVGLLFLLAFAVRLYNIDAAPLDFHATRQYRSLIIARGLFFDSSPSIPAWQHEVAAVSQSNQGVFEPPIMELLVSTGYRLLGGEALWLPRLLSSVFWLVGGVFLHSIIRRIADPLAALFGTAFYLFLPFAVVASRSFQPDPLMIMLMLASIWAILRHDVAPSRQRMIAAGALSALAIVVHPRSTFVLLAVFVSLSVLREGIRGLAGDRRAIRSLIAFGAVALVPPLIVYGYAISAGVFRSGEAQANILPQLWWSAFLWQGWLFNIGVTVGLTAFFGGLLGIFLHREGSPRALVLGMWAGYFALGLVYDYAIATHDYDHLQLVPIVAISTAPILALVISHLSQARPSFPSRSLMTGILCVALAVTLVEARGRLANPDWQWRVAVKEEIGAIVGHSTRTIFLSSDYGVALEYHGLLAGTPWPLAADLEWERLAGVAGLHPLQRLDELRRDEAADYFIVEDLAEFNAQPELKDILTQTYPVLASSSEYLIYDLLPRPDT